MAVKDKYKIERRYITNKLARSGGKINKVLFLVAHETANDVADADAHFRYFNNVKFQTSAHTFVDHRKILEIIPLDEKAWHVQYQVTTDNVRFGDDANDAAIGIELCRTGSFNQAYDRYIWYHAYLCKKFNLDPRKHIASHKSLDPRRRTDPESWLNPNGITWNRFISDVEKYYDNWEGTTEIGAAPEQEVESDQVLYDLTFGDTGPKVREMQRKLIALGYSLSGGADGSFGPSTDRAVRAFQRDQGLVVDGSFGPATQKALARAKPTSNAGSGQTLYDLTFGDTGPKVREMQQKLIALGYSLSGGADGSFGPSTDRAVRAFQRDQGLAVDGSYGPATQRALQNAKPTGKFNLPNTNYWVKNPQFHGAGVREVQEALASLYFYPEKGAANNGIDGYYGPKTADAVRRFQLQYMGVGEADGNYGPKTKHAMESVL